MNVVYLLICSLWLIAAKDKKKAIKVSPLEDLTSDVPRDTSILATIRDTVGGKKISTNGAPVVLFQQGDPVIVSSIANGTQIPLRAFRSYGSVVYWSVDYQTDSGKTREGWVSGIFLDK